jgi:homocysteine S-methyltransferase
LQALLQFPDIPAWFSFTCRDGLHTVHGELISHCANSLSGHPQVAAIGVNCTSPDHISSLISEIRRQTDKPIVIYSNSGQTWDATARNWIGKPSPHSWEQRAVQWVQQGANWIGGCCGTTRETIRHIRAALELNFPSAFDHEKSASA